MMGKRLTIAFAKLPTPYATEMPAASIPTIQIAFKKNSRHDFDNHVFYDTYFLGTLHDIDVNGDTNMTAATIIARDESTINNP